MEIKANHINGKLSFDSSDFKKLQEEYTSFSQKMHKMIDHILTKDNSQKEELEICQVGKFLVLLDESIEIKEKSESPDFIIQMEGKTIGLEHETIRNKTTVENIGSVRNLVKRVEEYFIKTFPNSLAPFIEEYPNCPNMIVDIRFNDDLFSFKKRESLKLSIEIANYIYSFVNGIDTNKPEYIYRVSISPHTKVNFTVRTDINRTEKLEVEVLDYFIERK